MLTNISVGDVTCDCVGGNGIFKGTPGDCTAACASLNLGACVTTRFAIPAVTLYDNCSAPYIYANWDPVAGHGGKVMTIANLPHAFHCGCTAAAQL
jgi:hypothetical protein